MTKWTEKVPGFLGRFYTVFLMTVAMSQTAYADIFDTAKTAMQKVYTDVAGLATVAAVVCAAVCLFLMNFSRSGKTVVKAHYRLLGGVDDVGCNRNIHGKYHSEEYVFTVEK